MEEDVGKDATVVDVEAFVEMPAARLEPEKNTELDTELDAELDTGLNIVVKKRLEAECELVHIFAQSQLV